MSRTATRTDISAARVRALVLVAGLGAGANGNQAFTLTATGSGPVAGYTYTINQVGARATAAHPKGANAACWSIRGSTCDS